MSDNELVHFRKTWDNPPYKGFTGMVMDSSGNWHRPPNEDDANEKMAHVICERSLPTYCDSVPAFMAYKKRKFMLTSDYDENVRYRSGMQIKYNISVNVVKTIKITNIFMQIQV